jgi:hypothetical protein
MCGEGGLVVGIHGVNARWKRMDQTARPLQRKYHDTQDSDAGNDSSDLPAHFNPPVLFTLVGPKGPELRSTNSLDTPGPASATIASN